MEQHRITKMTINFIIKSWSIFTIWRKGSDAKTILERRDALKVATLIISLNNSWSIILNLIILKQVVLQKL